MVTEFGFRQKIRAAAIEWKGREVISPEVIETRASIVFDRLIEQFGSIACAAIQAGVPYLNITVYERAIAGDNYPEWTQSR